MAMTFISMAFVVVALSLGSLKTEFKMKLFHSIDPHCHLVRWLQCTFTDADWIPSPIWPLFYFKFTASLLFFPLSAVQFGVARLCWLGRCHALLIECPSRHHWKLVFGFHPLKHKQSLGFEYQCKWGEECLVSSLWETLLTERTSRPVCHWHSKDLFGLCLCLGKWRGVLRIDEKIITPS